MTLEQEDKTLKFKRIDEVSHFKYAISKPFKCTIRVPKDMPVPSTENLLAQVNLIKNWYKTPIKEDTK